MLMICTHITPMYISCFLFVCLLCGLEMFCSFIHFIHSFPSQQTSKKGMKVSTSHIHFLIQLSQQPFMRKAALILALPLIDKNVEDQRGFILLRVAQ